MKIILIILAAYAFLTSILPALVLHFLCDRHISYKTVYSSREFGLPRGEQMTLTTDDGLRIWTQLFTPDHPRGVIVIVSGIDGPSVTSFGAYARKFLDMGLAVYTPELRAHGPSEGNRICLAYAETADVKAVCDHACGHFPGLPLTLMGLSMGASTVLRATGDDPRVGAVVSMSGFSSIEDYIYAQTKKYIGPLPAYPLRLTARLLCCLKYRVDARTATPLEGVRKLNGRPVLMVHSRHDRIVPYYCFLKLSEQAGKVSDKLRAITIEGQNHFIINDMRHLEKDKAFIPELLKFLQEFSLIPDDGNIAASC